MSEALWLALGKHTIMSAANGTLIYPCIRVGKNGPDGWFIHNGAVFLGPFNSEDAADKAFGIIKSKLNVVDSGIPDELWLKPNPKTISPEDYKERKNALLDGSGTAGSFRVVVGKDGVEDKPPAENPEHPKTPPDDGGAPGPGLVPPVGFYQGPG